MLQPHILQSVGHRKVSQVQHATNSVICCKTRVYVRN